MDFIVILVKFC